MLYNIIVRKTKYFFLGGIKYERHEQGEGTHQQTLSSNK